MLKPFHATDKYYSQFHVKLYIISSRTYTHQIPISQIHNLNRRRNCHNQLHYKKKQEKSYFSNFFNKDMSGN